MGAQTLGIAIVKVDGQALRSEPGASIDIGGFARTEVMGDQPGDVGYAQKNAPSQVDCVLMMDSSTSLAAIAGWSDVTVQFDADTGQSYVVNHAFLSNTPKATAGQGGKVQLTFKGPPAREV